MLRHVLIASVFAAFGVMTTASACNAISGVEELEFDLEGNVGGLGGVGGIGGAGGEGGLECAEPCNDPGSDCLETMGTCVDGECMYTPRAEGADCDDGDPCTEADRCDTDGMCVPGELCPNDDPCVVATCEQGVGCMDVVHPDGTSCGMLASERCCGGACVDTSTDVDHCGGCGYACATGLACESIAVTTECAISTPDTTGRCLCQGLNSQCPVNQICRGLNPGMNRCAPRDQADCPGTTFVDQQSCPNFCQY